MRENIGGASARSLLRMGLAVGLFLLPGSYVQAQEQDPKDAEIAQLQAQIAAKDADLGKARQALQQAATELKARPTLTAQQREAAAVSTIAAAVASAQSGSAAKGCKAGNGKRFSLVVLNGQAGWACEIDLSKVRP